MPIHYSFSKTFSEETSFTKEGNLLMAGQTMRIRIHIKMKRIRNTGPNDADPDRWIRRIKQNVNNSDVEGKSGGAEVGAGPGRCFVVVVVYKPDLLVLV